MRNLFAMIVGATLLISWSSYAAAHAALDHSQPSADAILASPPSSVQLWFTRPLEPSFSSARVTDQSGKQVDKGDSTVTEKESKLLTVHLQPLTSGTYKVAWRIVALDGHKSLGEFAFTIK